MNGGRSAALATGAMAVLMVLLPATPSGADAIIALNEPAVDGAGATISGTAEMTGPFDTINGVTIRVAHSGAGPTIRCDGCGADVHTNQRSVSFSFATGRLDYNGLYEVTVEVRGENLFDNDPAPARTTKAFRLEVPPATPANVEAVANPDGSVTVSWSRNTEPDLVGYRVERRDPAGSGFRPVAPAVDQPLDGPTVRWTDTTAALIGGRFEYQVVAVRPGGGGGMSGEAASTSVAATVSVPAPTGAQAMPGGAPVPGAGIGGLPGAPVNLASLLATAPGAGPGPGPSLDEPDNGFSQTLPFAARQNQVGSGGAPADDAVVILGHATNRRALLLPVAAGLILCVAAGQLRWLSRRMLRSTAGP